MLVIIKLTYALPAYAGQLTVNDKNRINAISRKAMHLTLTLSLTSLTANFFGRSLNQVTVCTTFSLLKPPPTVLTSFVRGNIHTCFPSFNICSLKTLILIVFYLNMCNSLTITSCFFQAAYCRFHALCFIFRVLYFVYFCVILLNCVNVCDCHTYHTYQ